MKQQVINCIKDLHNLSCNYQYEVKKLIIDINNVNYNQFYIDKIFGKKILRMNIMSNNKIIQIKGEVMYKDDNRIVIEKGTIEITNIFL